MMILKINVNTYRRDNTELQPYWCNLCNSRGRIMFTTEMYKTKQACNKVVARLRKGGLKFKVVDLT